MTRNGAAAIFIRPAHQMTQSKILFYDLETTGVRHYENGIHQIAGLVEIDGEVVEEINLKVKPAPDRKIEASALLVCGVTLEQINEYPDPAPVFGRLCAILNKYVSKFDRADKFHLCGYNNAGFDNQFLRDFWRDSYFGSYFYVDTLDVMVLLSQAFLNRRASVPDFKLATMARVMGIDVQQTALHDALYDVKLTRDIYRILYPVGQAEPAGWLDTSGGVNKQYGGGNDAS